MVFSLSLRSAVPVGVLDDEPGMFSWLKAARNTFDEIELVLSEEGQDGLLNTDHKSAFNFYLLRPSDFCFSRRALRRFTSAGFSP
jgi:hypothetical protein